MEPEGAGTDEPLSGVRVLDLSSRALSGIGRRLAELGADVLRIEPPGERRADQGDMDVDTVAVAIARFGKAHLALDLGKQADRGAFEELASRADLLIETAPPGSEQERVLDVAGLHMRNPGLVTLSVSPFGRGSHERWQATDPVLQALAGPLSRSGAPNREPLLAPADLALNCAIEQAFFLLLLAYFHRLRSGVGDHLEVSLLEAAAQAFDPSFGMGGSAISGMRPADISRGDLAGYLPYPIVRCADGFVRLCILAPRQWKAMFAWMGEPPEFADPSFETTLVRIGSRPLQEATARFLSEKTCAAVEAESQRRGIPIASLRAFDEAIDAEHFCARDVFASLPVAEGVAATAPNGVFVVDGARAVAHERTDRGAWGPRKGVSAGADEPFLSGRPLAGVRVLDLGVIIAGAEQGRLLADFGAEVIKVENSAFPDGSRQIQPGMASGGKISPSFACGNRNKKSIGLNLRTAEGRDLFLGLARKADVVLSNFKPGTLESLGLDNATLLRANPRLILADSSAFGATGPWSGRMGYGPLVRASAGLTALWRYEDEPETFRDSLTVYPDHVAARVVAAGVIALLIRRASTGGGGVVSVSQAEVMLSHLSAQIAQRSLERTGVTIEGSAHDAPWGVFACAGEDEWCVVTVRDDADWASLCRVMERGDLAADPALAHADGRRAQRAHVEAALEAWLVEMTPHAAMTALQGAGVPAGAVLRPPDLLEFPPLARRGALRMMRQTHMPEPFYVQYECAPSENIADPPLRSAPLRGEHTREIASDLLELEDEEIDRLIAAGVLELD